MLTEMPPLITKRIAIIAWYNELLRKILTIATEKTNAIEKQVDIEQNLPNVV